MTEYSANTTNATNTVTATPAAEDANVSIVLNGSTSVTNGTPATWALGENELVITVTNGNVTKEYTVKVTKAE